MTVVIFVFQSSTTWMYDRNLQHDAKADDQARLRYLRATTVATPQYSVQSSWSQLTADSTETGCAASRSHPHRHAPSNSMSGLVWPHSTFGSMFTVQHYQQQQQQHQRQTSPGGNNVVGGVGGGGVEGTRWNDDNGAVERRRRIGFLVPASTTIVSSDEDEPIVHLAHSTSVPSLSPLARSSLPSTTAMLPNGGTETVGFAMSTSRYAKMRGARNSEDRGGRENFQRSQSMSFESPSTRVPPPAASASARPPDARMIVRQTSRSRDDSGGKRLTPLGEEEDHCEHGSSPADSKPPPSDDAKTPAETTTATAVADDMSVIVASGDGTMTEWRATKDDDSGYVNTVVFLADGVSVVDEESTPSGEDDCDTPL